MSVKSREAAIRRTERAEQAAQRLEAIRAALRAQNVSYGELAELQSLAPYIESGDTELLEAAGVPEVPEQIVIKVPANFTEVTPAELRQRAAEELAAEFGTDVEEWLI